MELDRVAGEAVEESAASPLRRVAWALPAYISILVVIAIGLFIASLILTPLGSALGPDAWVWSIGSPPAGMVVLFLVLAVFVGELRPVPIPREREKRRG